MPLLYINHDHRQGALPSGKWVEMKEDDYGLYGQGQLFMDTEKGRHAYVAMKEGVLTGLSIGYIVEKFNSKDEGGRYLEEITLKEVSPVVAPCEEKARITDVKHIIDELMSMKDLEHFLRESGGFSKSVATAFVGQIVRVSRGEHVEQKNQITEQLGAQALSVISSLKDKL
jgi:HK97 family phage prohead protease